MQQKNIRNHSKNHYPVTYFHRFIIKEKEIGCPLYILGFFLFTLYTFPSFKCYLPISKASFLLEKSWETCKSCIVHTSNVRMEYPKTALYTYI